MSPEVLTFTTASRTKLTAPLPHEGGRESTEYDRFVALARRLLTVSKQELDDKREGGS